MDSPSTSKASLPKFKLDPQTRQLAMRVLEKCTLESINNDSFYKLHQTIPRVALYTGLSRNEVMDIMEADDDLDDKMILEIHQFDYVTEEFKERVIFNTINEYKLYENKDHTMTTLRHALREKILLPTHKLSEIINRMKYHVKRIKKSIHIVERPERALKRYQYLKKIKEFRRNQRPIYYIHRIYGDVDLYMSKTWKKVRNQSNEDKYVIFSAGSSSGLMNETLSIIKFEQRKLERDHGRQFKEWLKTYLFPFVRPNSVIVIDNDVYMDLQNIPPEHYRIETLYAWLDYKGIAMPAWETITDCDMTDILEACKTSYDDVFKNEGHELLVVPQYLADFNLMEIAWDEIIDRFSSQPHGDKLSLDEIKKSIDETIALVQTERWQEILEHVLTMEQEFWTKDKRMEKLILYEI